MDLSNKYPSASKVTVGPHAILQIYDPEHMKVVLNSPVTMEKNGFYDFVKPWAETGLILASGNLKFNALLQARLNVQHQRFLFVSVQYSNYFNQ